jgi:hypothetical protein
VWADQPRPAAGEEKEEEMNARIRTRIGAIAAAGTFVLTGAAAAQTGQRPPGMTAQQYKAELARGEALNKRYHLGTYSLAAQSGPRPAGMTTQQWQAELIRADALNRRYGLGGYAGTLDASAVNTSAAAPAATASPNFDWSSAGIGAGAAVGLGLLASGMLVAVRHSRRSLTA